MKSKYLYVIYPGACGGNHVCNMISLCEGFEQRVSSIAQPNYKEWLLNHYSEYNFSAQPHTYVNAHLVANIHHVDRLYEYVDKEHALNPTNTLIVQGHLFNFWAASDNGILEELGSDYNAIIMSYPPKNSMPWKRIEAYNYESPVKEYTFPLDICKGHPIGKPKSRSLEINENNGFYLDTVKFFTLEGSQYLRELLQQHFEVDLPIEADELHSMWFKWMTHVLKPENIEYWNSKQLT
jgi:hypothetical protein